MYSIAVLTTKASLGLKRFGAFGAKSLVDLARNTDSFALSGGVLGVVTGGDTEAARVTLLG